jgi:radical SAM protein with 4Fe4S-binding SPASM domain
VEKVHVKDITSDISSIMQSEIYPLLVSSLHFSPTYGELVAYRTKTFREGKSSLLNLDGVNLLRICTGQNTIEEISHITGFNIKTILHFLAIARKRGDVRFFTEPRARGLDVTGSYDYFYPIHLQFELTTRCNLQCEYCYRFCGPEKAEEMDYKSLISSVRHLSKIGLREIGITGGEPTLHPHFNKIIHNIAKFTQIIEINTNGVETEVLCDLVSNLNKKLLKKINFSISLNRWESELNNSSLSEEFKSTLRTIQEFTTRGIPVRLLATSLDPSESMIALLKNIISQYISLPNFFELHINQMLPFGRGCKIVKKLSSIKRSEPQDAMDHPNCQLGFRHGCVSPNGSLRPCALFPPNFTLGNLYDSKEQLFQKHIFHQMDHLPAPNTQICANCKFINFCNLCVIGGLSVPNRCHWKKHYGQELKNIFQCAFPNIR